MLYLSSDQSKGSLPPALPALLVVLILHLLDPESATGPKGKPQGFLQSMDLSAALKSRVQAGRGAEEASQHPKLPVATNSPPRLLRPCQNGELLKSEHLLLPPLPSWKQSKPQDRPVSSSALGCLKGRSAPRTAKINLVLLILVTALLL